MSRDDKTAAAILAAGLGTRMGSDQPKALLSLGGRPIIKHVLDSVLCTGIGDVVVVVGHKSDHVREAVGNGVRYAVQECQRGTADALACAREALRDFAGYLLTLYCDVPFVPPDLLRKLLAECAAQRAAAAMVTVELEHPGAYGRIIRDAAGRVIGIKEAAGATPGELAVKEINAGIYCFQAPLIFDIVAEIRPDPVKGELYLTDAIGLLAIKGYTIAVVKVNDAAVVMGVNTPAELEQAEQTLRRMSLHRFPAP
jgi:bifunctional UDP-N-acetylglucosamine pyrophosphorylase/glucosamine-1-phosphate N-acetyltransferase